MIAKHQTKPKPLSGKERQARYIARLKQAAARAGYKPKPIKLKGVARAYAEDPTAPSPFEG